MKTIVGVPESLTHAQYVSLIESVGFDPKRLRRLEFGTDGIYAEVYEPGPSGSGIRIETSAPDASCKACGRLESDAAVSKVYIPVRDPDPDPT